MNNQANKQANNNKNNRIKCDVCNCVHNDQCSGCTAKEIIVGPDFATNCNDTVCGTFKKSDF